MSGPPHWLAYAWVVSLWVAAGCVGMAGVAAVVDWRERRALRRSPPRMPIPGPQWARGAPRTPSCGSRVAEGAPGASQGPSSVPRPQPEPQTRTNHTDMETR